jgi:hypothetical protein
MWCTRALFSFLVVSADPRAVSVEHLSKQSWMHNIIIFLICSMVIPWLLLFTSDPNDLLVSSITQSFKREILLFMSAADHCLLLNTTPLPHRTWKLLELHWCLFFHWVSLGAMFTLYLQVICVVFVVQFIVFAAIACVQFSSASDDTFTE